MIERWYTQVTSYVLSHLQLIAMAVAAALLTIYWPDLTRFIKRRTRSWPLLARSALFIAVVGIGFGALVLIIGPILESMLLAFGRSWLLPLLLATVITLGVLAERRRQI